MTPVSICVFDRAVWCFVSGRFHGASLGRWYCDSCIAENCCIGIKCSTPNQSHSGEAFTAMKDDAPAAVKAAMVNVADLDSISGGGG
jgi:hypothetical protein